MTRPWTAAGTVAFAAHVFYELGAGVAMPLASRFGAGPVAVAYGVTGALTLREAARQPPSRDPAFAVVNGLFLSGVIAHVASWPRASKAGLPWLTECEGLGGRLMPPYNLLLYVSAVAGLAGLVENRRGALWGALTPAVVVPVLIHETPREYARLVEQAARRPRWWNRRLQAAR